MYCRCTQHFDHAQQLLSNAAKVHLVRDQCRVAQMTHSPDDSLSRQNIPLLLNRFPQLYNTVCCKVIDDTIKTGHQFAQTFPSAREVIDQS